MTIRSEGLLSVFVVWTAFIGPSAGQVVTQIEDFEFAITDHDAAQGVFDLTDPENLPTYYINGEGDGEGGASEGLYALGTDALFGASGVFVPGSYIGCLREISTDLFPTGQVELLHTYGDPNVQGPEPPDFPLSELGILTDVYGGEGFGFGLLATHLWINLIDAEGERYQYVNYSEVALWSEAYTLDLPMGTGLIRIDPDSLVEVPDGDRLLTEIVAFEMLIQDEDDPPDGFGKWYIDNLRIVEPEIIEIAPGDFDQDGDVDAFDAAAFEDCYTGIDGPIVDDGCETFDFDGDADVDFHDYRGFQMAFTGP